MQVFHFSSHRALYSSVSYTSRQAVGQFCFKLMNPYKFVMFKVCCITMELSYNCLFSLSLTKFTIMRFLCGDTHNPNLPCSKPLTASASLLCIKVPSCFQCFEFEIDHSGSVPDKLNTENCIVIETCVYLALIVVASFVVLVQPAVAKGVNTTPPNKFVFFVGNYISIQLKRMGML